MTAPRFKPGVKLRNDPVRGTILLAPERVLTLDETAVAIVSRIDGAQSPHEIAAALVKEFDADASEILRDVEELLDQLAAQGYVSR